MSDLVKKLMEDPDERLQTLKEIRGQMISGTSYILSGNMKKLILALKQCLAFQQSNVTLKRMKLT